MIPTYRSTSQRRTIKTCGWKYFLKYDQGWYSKVTKPGTLLGSITHKVIESAVKAAKGQSPLVVESILAPSAFETNFHDLWDAIRDQPGIEWTPRRKFDVMRARGGAMAAKAATWILEHVDVHNALVEQKLTFRLHDGSEELVIVDLIAPIDGKMTVLDWKTSDREYDELRPELDEQLSAGQVAAEQTHQLRIEQVGLGVLLWTGTPAVQALIVPARQGMELAHFIASAKAIDDQILRKQFHKNPEACFQWGRCEMYPLCYRSARAKVDELLEKREVITAEEEMLLDE